MAISDKLIQTGYDYAKEIYAQYGVDVDKAMEKAAQLPVSMHCWQADDVIGCENAEGGAKDGIATTGNYPGRARNADEIRADADLAMSMIPGARKFNLHASYAELHGKKIDRDAYTIAEFQSWVDWAKEKNVGLDFNPTYFGHSMVKDGFTLSSPDKAVRDFWIEHGKRCREIGEEFAKQLGKTCVINYWMPDGMKDTPADTAAPRQRMIDSLDKIFEKKIDEKLVLEGVESKLFALGLESYTVGSHELMLGYALTRGKMVTLDAGHFHPTEVISAKISACMQFLDHILLHVSRGVRWDSDHVITLDDELMRLFGGDRMQGLMEKVGMSEDAIAAGMLSKTIENAQKRVESRNFEVRKYVLQYDNVMNKQREVIYGERRKVLFNDEVKEYIMGMMETLVGNIVQSVTVSTKYSEEWDFASLNEKLRSITFNWPEMVYNEEKMHNWTPEDLEENVLKTMYELYALKEKEIGEETMRELEKMVMLRVIDNRWMDHIDAMDDLKQGIGLRSLGQMDPAVAYANEGFDMFEELEADIQEETVRFCYNVTKKTTTTRKSVVSQEEERKDEYRDEARSQAARQSSPNMPKEAPKPEEAKRPETFRRETPKVGRNELCPCGSGKKYKNCHGKMQ